MLRFIFGVIILGSVVPLHGDVMTHPVNAPLVVALRRFGTKPMAQLAQRAVQPVAVQAVVRPVQVQAVSQPMQKATVFENLCATTDLGGKVSSPGPRGNWRTNAHDAYVALPNFNLMEKIVYVRCRCPRHITSGVLVPFPVFDCGPWSTNDRFIEAKCRPMAESGRSNIYRHVPRRAPAIDITPEAWKALGHEIGYGRQAGNHSGYVDLVIIDTVVQRKNTYIDGD